MKSLVRRMSVGAVAALTCLFQPAWADEVPSMTIDKTFENFVHPDAAHRGKPFWSWNGKLDRAELLRQIDAIKDMGFGGFFMHSRTGLATEYLGQEWFDLINACADKAETLGLESWLYDEDRWPSGSAGGKATADPKYRMKYLKMDIVDGSTFHWRDGLLAAFSCTLSGLDYTEAQPVTAATPAADYAAKQVLTFEVVPMDPHSFYNGNTYLDTLNREATDHFVAMTHEQYKKHCGDRLGRSIRGIFTDEPHHGMVMCKNVSQGSQNKSELCTPWTEGLPAAFKKRFGYDLVPRLPELFLRPGGEHIRPIKWQYMELLQQMFLDNWAKPIQEWCKANNMILTGHVLHEDSLGSQAVPCGSVMRYYEYMDYPGVDVLSEGNRNYWIVKQLSSAARQFGKPWMLSELYGCTGWQFNFASHKAVGDWQSLFGINLRCPHLSWYTMEGESKRDFPASIFYQSAWYPDYAAVETYFARMQTMMMQGAPDCGLLVLNPVESAWAQIYTGWATWLTSIDPDVERVNGAYQQLFLWLCGAQLDFDLGDEDILARHGRVETVDGKPVLRVGEAHYRAVVMPVMDTVRSSTLDLLEAFQKAGGEVVAVGDAPAYVDATPSERAKQVAKNARGVALEQGAVAGACSQAVPKPVQVTLQDHAPATEIFCQSRSEGSLRYVLALNTNRGKGFAKCRVRIEGAGAVEEWDCLTGKRWTLPARAQDGGLEFETDFAPAGERLFVAGVDHSGKDTVPPVKPVYKTLATQTLEGPYRYTLDEPNICVLDRASCKLDDGAWQEAQEILKVDHAVREKLGMPQRGGEMLQPWFSGQTPKTARAKLALRFEFMIDAMPEDAVLLVERPERFELLVNDKPVNAPTDGGWMIDPCFKKVPLAKGLLQNGKNTVELRVGFHEDINLESVYLAGSFGVRLDGTQATLVTLPETLRAGTVTDQGLPFYSGRIRYQLPMPAKQAAQGQAFLTVPKFEGACVQAVNAGEKRIIPWAPYEAEVSDWTAAGKPLEAEVVLTRRNTFGPLHQIPLRAGGYGPDNWTTTGKNFSETYMLYPAGLLEAPALEWREEVK